MYRDLQHIKPFRSVNEWNTRTWAYHLLFWVSLAALFAAVSDAGFPSLFSFGIELINMGFYAALVYLNVFFLVPVFLSRKRFLAYVLWVVLASATMMMAKVVIFFFLHTGNAKGVWLENQALIFSSFLFATGLSTIVKISFDWLNYQREKQEITTRTVTSELQFLRSQINPHFLFNTLNSLYALTLKKSDNAPEIVLKLSEMMRYMLYECNEKTVLLANEIKYIQNYLDLERLRHGPNADIRLNIKGNVDNQRIAPLFFIPFLENSFKHGLNHQIHKGFVHIDLEVADKFVRMAIENSKPPEMPLAPSKRSGGVGLVNVKKRLQLIYPERHRLIVKQGPEVYSMELTIEFE